MPVDFKISEIREEPLGTYVLVRMYNGVASMGPEPNQSGTPQERLDTPIINVNRYRRTSLIKTVEYTFNPGTPVSEMVKAIAEETSKEGILNPGQEAERTAPGNAATIRDQHVRS